MNKVIKTAAVAVATLAVATSAIVSPLTASAYWDDKNGQMPSLWLKDCDASGDHCTLTDMDTKTRSFKNDFTPVFNNIYNNSAYGGDEKNFVGAIATKNATGKGTVWTNDVLEVEDGEIYSIRMYIHNDNPNGEKAASTGTSVAFNIPQGSAAEQTIDGYIYSDNAASKMVSDFVTLKSKDGHAFHLEYQYGKSLIRNLGYANVDGGVKLGDEVVTNAANKGIKIGYAAEGDGIIPGCFGYTANVVVKVKVVYDYFTIDKKVRLAGTDDEFTESIDAKVGDRVEYKIVYRNTDQFTQKDVMIKDILPKNMVYVGNSTYLRNKNHKDDNDGKGMQLLPDGALFTTGVNIGDYTSKSSASVYFTAEVVDKDLACGDNVLVNWAQGSVTGLTVNQDHSKVKLTKVCENDPTPTPELPKAGPVVTLGGAVAAGTIVTAAGYFIMSRRALR